MPLIQGSVVVADDGTVTYSDPICAARRFFDADIATLPLATAPALDNTDPPYSAARPASADDIAAIEQANIRAKQEAARRANANAAAVYAILTIDTHALVTSESLGVLPDPPDAGAAIDPPASPVSLPLG